MTVVRAPRKKGRNRLGVVTPLIDFSAQPILTSFLQIFSALYDDVFVATRGFNPEHLANSSQNIHIRNINYGLKRDTAKTLAEKAFENIVIPLSLCLEIIRMPRGTKTVVFLLGTIVLIPPIIIAKLLRKKTVYVLTGLYSKNAEAFYQDTLFDRTLLRVLRILDRFTLSIVNQIIGYTSNTVAEFDLDKFKYKIWGNGARFIDTELLKISTDLKERGNLVGYIGRFRGEKGTLNFADAIPLLSQERPDLEFSMVGNGPLLEEVEQRIKSCNSSKITLTKWIDHDEVPPHLNRLKLLVIPSNSETGPYIALEAMACGTPILATPCGFIPDIIKDGETGFILEDNSPESVAQNVLRALNHPNLEQIVSNAQKAVAEGYTFEAAVEKYKRILG
ncbi:glycosyltransferase family 4 protein [Chloroflexota bacterium]